MFTIDPLVVAYGPHREKSRFTYLHNAGQKVDIPYVAWLLQDGDQNILVDVGCSADDYADHIRPTDAPLVHAGETFDDVVDVAPLEQQLDQRGLRPTDIDVVVLTHLDWDHCMNAPAFPDSRFLVQRDEWDNIPAHPLFENAYAPERIYDAIQGFDLELLDGDTEIADGLELIFTPGHSPGGQSIVIDTTDGRFVIGGLCVLKENFYPPEDVLERGHYQVIPPGGHTDLFESYESMLRILDVGGDNVLPLHMSEVMEMGSIGA